LETKVQLDLLNKTIRLLNSKREENNEEICNKEFNSLNDAVYITKKNRAYKILFLF